MSLSVIVPSLIVILSVLLAYRSLKLKFTRTTRKFFDNVVLLIKVPKKIEEKVIELQGAPIASEHMFASLHGLLRSNIRDQEQISFEIASSPEGIRFFAVVPRPIRSFVESQIYAQYPEATIEEAEDYTSHINESSTVMMGANIVLSKEQFFPIKTFKDFEVDPISAITSALSEVRGGDQLWFQLLILPVPDVWQEQGYDYLKKLREGLAQSSGSLIGTVLREVQEIFLHVIKRITLPAYNDPNYLLATRPGGPPVAQASRLTSGQELQVKAIENKLSKMGFQTVVRVATAAGSKEGAELRLRSLIASLKQFSTANLNSFVSGPYETGESFFNDYKSRMFPSSKSYVLNTEELASLFHLPASTVETPTIAWSHAKRGEPPLNLPTESCTFFGITNFRNKQVKFGVRDEDRLRHMYLIGKTGSGKSYLFRNMIIQDMRNGKGVGVLDPHGTLIDEILAAVPENRVDDVVYFDPSDEDRPVALNMLEVLDPKQKNLMASGIVSAVKQQFGFSWGPRLEYLLNIAVLTLLEVEGTTMLGITRILTDDNYRKFILHNVKDPVIKEFWEREFKEMKGNQKLLTEAVAPIQNKIGRFLSSSTIRNILGRPKSTVRVDEIMNGGKIFLINLSKGKIGEDNANLLGSLLVSRMQFVALQRANMAEKDRKPFYLFVDEFQNFTSGSFESILSEARKYKLSLHMTHQYTSQLPEEILNAVFGNVGTLVSFALGAPDAEVLAREFAPVFEENDLISLERQHIYLKLMIDGMTSAPFSAISMPAITDFATDPARPVEASRQKYGQDKAYVEEKIKLWVERKFDLGMAIAEENRLKRPQEPSPAEQAPVLPGQQSVALSELPPESSNTLKGEIVLERKE